LAQFLACLLLATQAAFAEAPADDVLPVIGGVAAQPLASAAQRLAEALDYLGSPLQPADRAALEALMLEAANEDAAAAIQRLLDPYCLAFVHINPEARVKVSAGPAPAVLLSGGWRNFLVKVHNQGAVRAELEFSSPNTLPVVHASSGQPNPKPENAIAPGEVAQRFLEASVFGGPPLARALSGLAVEYRVLQLYTAADGPREALVGFHVGQGTQDIGFRNNIPVLFDVRPTVKLKLRVRDFDGSPVMASFIIRDNIDRFSDRKDRNAIPLKDYRLQKAHIAPWLRWDGLPAKALAGVYPLPSRRVADLDEYPDFFFQPQVYRADGEHVMLPPGIYDITYTRGPEYLPQTRTITVPTGVEEHTEVFDLKRWTHLAARGWYSLDHHVHAGGCSHYESPAAGVRPEAMMRQAQGEDLNVACVLTWGPCWYHQKTFFDGEVSALSTAENLMRYDVEVSGFPSSHAGHLCLLRLKEDDYPGTTRIEEWPSWTQPVLQWGKEQGGVVGYSHSGWGLEPMHETHELPNHVMAKFDGIGANEYIVTVTQGACDFISAGDTPLPTELNIWYHTLNTGQRAAISGETDFPCIFDDRIGMARSYGKLGDTLSFDAFAQKIKEGGVYVSDGRAHLLDFRAEGVEMGIDGSELRIDTPREIQITAEAFAWLAEEQDEAGALIAQGGLLGRPYWHVEKARVRGTRRVPVELLVNGYPVARQEIVADGTPQAVSFTHRFEQSGWIALRVLASAHTNPIYVLVGDKPIRASKRSALWCRAAVDQCWKMKSPAIRPEERPSAEAAYNAARRIYDEAIATSHDDTAPENRPKPLRF